MKTELIVKEPVELKEDSMQLSDSVYSLKITDAIACATADDFVKDCIKLEKKIKSFFADSKKSATQLHKKIVAMERTQLKPVSEMKSYLKNEMSKFIANEELYNDAIHLFNCNIKNAKDLMNIKNIEDFVSKDVLNDYIDVSQKAIIAEKKHLDFYNLKQKSESISTSLKGVINAINQKALEVEKQKRREAEAEGNEYVEEVPDVVPVEEVEIKKPKTNLRKLSLIHEVSVVSLKKLAQAVIDGNVPTSWILPNESAIRKDAKEFEDTEDFYNTYKKSGVMIKITRSIR